MTSSTRLTQMPECWCRIGTVDYQKKSWCRTNFISGIPAFRYLFTAAEVSLKNFHGAAPRKELQACLTDRMPAHKQQSELRCTYWAKLHFLSQAAPSWAMQYPYYAASYWALMHTSELHCSLLNQGMTYWATMDSAELSCTLPLPLRSAPWLFPVSLGLALEPDPPPLPPSKSSSGGKFFLLLVFLSHLSKPFQRQQQWKVILTAALPAHLFNPIQRQ